MTFDPRRGRRLAEHRALSAALTLAKLAGWSIDRHAPLLPKAFEDYLYVPQAELLLVATVDAPGKMKGLVTRATREARSDALIVSIGRNSSGLFQPYVSAGLWSVEATRWHGPYLPWIYCDGEPWLLPDPLGGNDDDPCLRLSGRPLRPAQAKPWQSMAERYVGFARADAAFASLQKEAL